MAKYLALDWDRVEARMIVAHSQGDGLQVDSVHTAALEFDPRESNLAGLEEQLKKALGLQKLPRCQTLTAIGRSQVELRMLKLPPAPEEELPEMVRFQAMREFSALGEDSPLDFLPLGAAGAEPGEVMAASIPKELASQVHGALTSGGFEPRRAVLRPCAATSLAMRRCARAQQGVTMVIAQLADSAELAISKDGTVVFTRAFRLPLDWHPGETGEPLLGEVRRSIAAAQNQLGGSAVEHIVFFGTPEEHDGLCAQLRQRTALDVELIDPFDGVPNAGAKPAQPERFGALLGMLHDEVAQQRPAIDFINPRKKPQPKSNRRLNVLIASAAAVILLAVGALVFSQFHQRNKQIAELQKQKRDNEATYQQLKSDVELAKMLDDWKAADRDWLALIHHLSSVEDPSADDIRIDRIHISSLQNRPGIAEIFGRANNDAAASKLLEKLANDDYAVEPGRTSISREDERYTRAFSARINTSKSIPIETTTPSPGKPADAATDAPVAGKGEATEKADEA